VKAILLSLCIALPAFLPTIDASAADQEVEPMLKVFYKWYIPHLEQKPGEKSDHKMSDFVTDSLLARIDKLREPEEEGGIPALDWDPFLNAQDFEADWATNVQVQDVRVNGDDATAKVELGGKEKSTIRLSLVRRDGHWKIDNFIPKL
jgi:uncharacterized protein DUF3828